MTRLEWTEARDSVLRGMRAEGRTWQEIGADLGVTPDVARERGRRIGTLAAGQAPNFPAEDPCRPPLPAGHPRSWGLLIENTVLAGTGWPGWE